MSWTHFIILDLLFTVESKVSFYNSLSNFDLKEKKNSFENAKDFKHKIIFLYVHPVFISFKGINLYIDNCIIVSKMTDTVHMQK